MDITLVCVPYQVDVTRWGYAQGPKVQKLWCQMQRHLPADTVVSVDELPY